MEGPLETTPISDVLLTSYIAAIVKLCSSALYFELNRISLRLVV